MKKLFFPYVLIILILLSGCGKQAEQIGNKEPINLTVSAAASLKNVMEEIKISFNQEKPEITITYNFGSSGSLQQQIEQGAPADLYISAASKQMNALLNKGLVIDETVKNLLGNRMVLIIPEESDAEIKDFEGASNSSIKKLALGEPKSVPAGQYAEEIFKNLDMLDAIKDKVVYAKDVKEVLTWVETGNADAGVVYLSDAKTSDKVKVVAAAAENTHQTIVYPAAVVSSSKNVNAAKEFLDFLSSEQARTIFEKYGFLCITE